jgi:hypothetical protein
MKNNRELYQNKTSPLLPLIVSFALIITQNAFASCSSGENSSNVMQSYIDNNNGTVTDKKTGLMWQKCSVGEDIKNNTCVGIIDGFTFDETEKVVQQVNAGENNLGHNDWRLPSIAELRTLLDESCSSPTLNAAIFPTTLNWFWSSSTNKGSKEQSVRVINFTNGMETRSSKNILTYIKLVRDTNTSFAKITKQKPLFTQNNNGSLFSKGISLQ